MSEKISSAEGVFSEGLLFLEEGNYQQAKERFLELLIIDSQNIEYQSGFFCSGWWLNRQESQKYYRSGRSLAFWLMHEWKAFSQQIKERNYQPCLCYRKTMEFVLRMASENFRKAFQEEGGASVDTKLLQELGKCLIQLGDYINACDILQYARTKTPQDPHLCFLLGEALCCLDGKEHVGRGLSYYRDAFMVNLFALEPEWVSSSVASETFITLCEAKQNDLEQTLWWFPAYLMAASFSYSLRPLQSLEWKNIKQEIQRLTQEKERVIEKYKEKVSAMLSFYLLIDMYQSDIIESEGDKGYLREGQQNHENEEMLNELSFHLYTFYQKKN